jgi:ribonuclease BN (tRNA processing enzyme)
MRLVTIGCSGSFAGPDSPASAYLVQVPAEHTPDGRDWHVVLDLGNGGLGVLQRFVHPVLLDAVCISHLHPDHFVDLCGLYVYLRYHPSGVTRQPLPVWGPEALASQLKILHTLPPDSPIPGFDLHVWHPGQVAAIGPLRIEAFPMAHPVETYGMRITGPSSLHRGAAILAYTGDTDTCAAGVNLARDADLLLAEAAFHEGRDDAVARGIHLTGRRAGEMATAAGAKRLVLTHIPAWNDPQRTRAEATAVYTGPVDVATTGAVFEV